VAVLLDLPCDHQRLAFDGKDTTHSEGTLGSSGVQAFGCTFHLTDTRCASPAEEPKPKMKTLTRKQRRATLASDSGIGDRQYQLLARWQLNTQAKGGRSKARRQSMSTIIDAASAQWCKNLGAVQNGANVDKESVLPHEKVPVALWRVCSAYMSVFAFCQVPIVDGLTYRLQGDSSLQTAAAIDKREDLQKSEAIKAAVCKFWETFDSVRLGSGSVGAQECQFFLVLCTKASETHIVHDDL
jgi:hypothetical protein